MNSFLLTLLLAFFLIVFAIAALAIGWIIKGKNKVHLGMCGRDPHAKKKDECGKNTSCGLCERNSTDKH